MGPIMKKITPYFDYMLFTFIIRFFFADHINNFPACAYRMFDLIYCNCKYFKNCNQCLLQLCICVLMVSILEKTIINQPFLHSGFNMRFFSKKRVKIRNYVKFSS